jgi:antitoxin component YwqK of YwqJK toxin-antitoxin module
MRQFLFLLFGIAVFLLPSCSTETVDTRNDQGQRVRYERNKKDFSKNGKFERFYEDGKLLEVSFYENDTLHGERRFFFPNGNLESMEHYRHGVLHGVYRKYYETGSVYLEQEFVDGAMQGSSKRYYSDGTVEEIVTIRNNEENGPFQEFYPNGKIKAEGTYIYEDEALEQGELREYDERGTLVRIADCERGLCRTRWKKE